MNKKILTHVLIAIVVISIGFRLKFISNSSLMLWNLLSEFLFSGDLFQAHILSRQSAFFWFHLIENSIPHIIILSLVIGLIKYFRSDKTMLNRYLILGIILTYFPTFLDMIILSVGISNFSAEQYFLTDPAWAINQLGGFIYVTFYFSLFRIVIPENLNVSENLKIRFKNYFIDTVYLLYVSRRFLYYIEGGEEIHYFIVYGIISILYFVYCEFLFGQSIGKTITNTHVNFQGNRFRGAIVRSFARRIPLEPFSFFFKGEFARWHDKLSNSQLETFR